MLMHALRVREAQPLYAAPALEFTSFAYMPVYPAVVALLSMPFGLDYPVARAVSIAGYALAILCGYVFLRRAGVARPLALCGIGFSAAAFGPTGAWYDLARVDSLWLGLLAAGLFAAWRARESRPAGVAGGLLLTAAFFTKQTAAPFVALVGLLFLAGRARGGADFIKACLAVGVPTLVFLQATSDNWSHTYAFGLHQRHGFDAWTALVVTPLRLGLLAAPALPLLFVVPWRGDRPLAATAAVAGAGLVASGLGAGTEWAYANALVPGVFFLGLLLALAASRAAARGGPWPALATVLLGLAVLSAPGGLVWMAARAFPAVALPSGYDPRPFHPTGADARAGAALEARLRSEPGRVLVPFHPFYAFRAGKEPTLHAMNLADVNRAGLGTPRDLVEAIRGRAFALIVMDVEGDGPRAEAEAMGQLPRLAGHYEIVERIEGPRVFSGAPVRPRLVLAPKER